MWRAYRVSWKILSVYSCSIAYVCKMIEDEDYQPRNRHKARQATYGRFWCDACDYYFGGEIGKCPVCGTKGNGRKIKYDRRRGSFNADT